jgi:hypothetical protein
MLCILLHVITSFTHRHRIKWSALLIIVLHITMATQYDREYNRTNDTDSSAFSQKEKATHRKEGIDQDIDFNLIDEDDYRTGIEER